MPKSRKQEAVERAAALSPKATSKQIAYLEILLNDHGYHSRLLRMAFVNDRISRKISFLDELTVAECSTLIEEFEFEKRMDDEDLDDEDNFWD